MAHPYKHHARKTGGHKIKAMGKHGNLPQHMMRGVGENMSGGIRESSASMQHAKQAASHGMYKCGGKVHGMKKGGRIGHGKKHKTNMSEFSPIPVRDPDQPTGVPPAMPEGGAPAPPMAVKHGGRTHHYAHGGRVHHSDLKEDKALVKHMVKPTALKRAHGGRIHHTDSEVPLKKNHMAHGSSRIPNTLPIAGHVTYGGGQGGVGRLEKARSGRR
jgi:hypothetical protein